MAEECRLALKRLGEAVLNASMFRSELTRIAERLYGERMGAADFMARYRSDLSRGRLRVEDERICSNRLCVDLAHLIRTMARYYRWIGERTKAIREVERTCIE